MPEGRAAIIESTFEQSHHLNDADVNPSDILKEINYKALESLPDAIVVINSKAEIVVFNHQAELMFGYDRVEVLGKSIELLLPEGLRGKHVELRNGYLDQPRVREMGAGIKLNGRKRTPAGVVERIFPVQISLSAMVVIGSGTHAMAVIRRVEKDQ